jgi:hypothetical protein
MSRGEGSRPVLPADLVVDLKTYLAKHPGKTIGQFVTEAVQRALEWRPIREGEEIEAGDFVRPPELEVYDRDEDGGLHIESTSSDWPEGNIGEYGWEIRKPAP